MKSEMMRGDEFLGERRRLLGRIVKILFWVAAAHIVVLAGLAIFAL